MTVNLEDLLDPPSTVLGLIRPFVELFRMTWPDIALT